MATYNTALGVLPSPSTQLFGGNAGGQAGTQGQGQQAPQPRQQQPAQGGTQTFAQMQQQGQARPAPQAFSFTPNIAPANNDMLGRQFQQSEASQQLLGQLMGRLNSMQQAQSVYDDPAFVQRRQAAMANLQAERQASESSLNEEMARRGLAASSIASGRMGDIAGQFARAQGSLEADLLKEAMAQEQQRQQFLTQQLGQTLGTVGGQELQAFQANVQSAQAERDIALRTAQLQMEAEIQGVTLSLTQARDIASAEYQQGQLKQAAADTASRERMSANELAMRQLLQQQSQEFQKGESALERELRLTLQSDQQKFQRGESALERELRTTMQTRELTAAEQRQLTEIEANKALEASRQTFQSQQNSLDRNIREAAQMSEQTGTQYKVVDGKVVPVLDANGKPVPTSAVSQAQAERESRAALQASQNTFTAGQNALDRGLRERLGLTEATGILYGADGKPVLDASGKPVQTLAGRQADASQTQSQNAFLAQLAAVLAPMDQKKRDEFLRDNPNIAALFGFGTRSAGTYSEWPGSDKMSI